jgi:hypothetical protein
MITTTRAHMLKAYRRCIDRAAQEEVLEEEARMVNVVTAAPNPHLHPRRPSLILLTPSDET